MHQQPSPFVFISLDVGRKIGKRFRSPIEKILAFFPSLRYDLKMFDIEEPESYVVSAILSALIFAGVFGAFILYAFELVGVPERTRTLGIISIFAIFLLIFVLNIFYPGIRLRTMVAKMDRDLGFALNDMLIQLEGGIPLFEAMVNVAHSNYGSVSDEFDVVVKEISTGTAESHAFQKMVLKTKSVYFKKALWQLINVLESGASLVPALRSVIETLKNYQYKAIKDYSSSLNFIVLIFMLCAAAVPSLGITFLIVLSAFAGMGVNEQIIITLVASSAIAQIVLIGYINSIRPAVCE